MGGSPENFSRLAVQRSHRIHTALVPEHLLSAGENEHAVVGYQRWGEPGADDLCPGNGGRSPECVTTAFAVQSLNLFTVVEVDAFIVQRERHG